MAGDLTLSSRAWWGKYPPPRCKPPAHREAVSRPPSQGRPGDPPPPAGPCRLPGDEDASRAPGPWDQGLGTERWPWRPEAWCPVPAVLLGSASMSSVSVREKQATLCQPLSRATPASPRPRERGQLMRLEPRQSLRPGFPIPEEGAPSGFTPACLRWVLGGSETPGPATLPPAQPATGQLPAGPETCHGGSGGAAQRPREAQCGAPVPLTHPRSHPDPRSRLPWPWGHMGTTQR